MSQDRVENLQERHRLVVLLRLLHDARPRQLEDEWIATVVDRLEDRVALSSLAENLEVVTCHLAPHVCRKLLHKNVETACNAAEEIQDAQEATVSKILTEILSLVRDEMTVITEDSIMGQAHSQTELALTIAALLQYAPQLGHEKVAQVLLNVPQGGTFIAKLGANCPAVIPTLVRGCLRVKYEQEAAARNAIRHLAALSKSEGARIIQMLTQKQKYVDLQLELGCKQPDAVLAALLLTKYLTKEKLDLRHELLETILSRLSREMTATRVIPRWKILARAYLWLCVRYEGLPNVDQVVRGVMHEDTTALSTTLQPMASWVILLTLTQPSLSTDHFNILQKHLLAITPKDSPFAHALGGKCVSSLMDLLVEVCGARDFINDIEMRLVQVIDKLSLDLMKVEDLECRNIESALVYARSDRSEVEKAQCLEPLLKNVLFQEDCSNLIINKDLPKFLRVAVEIMNRKGVKTPFIMPLQLEIQATKASFDEADPIDADSARFFVQLLYSFLFLSYEPKSPFGFDPRGLPLKEVVGTLVSPRSFSVICAPVRTALIDFVSRFAPEVRNRTDCYLRWRWSRHLTTTSVWNKTSFLQALRETIINPTTDPNGMKAEAIFCATRRSLSDADLCTTAVAALMSKAHEPPSIFSFSMICRDPMVLMKCPISLWSRKGWRRIIISILDMVLEVNDAMIHETLVDEESQQELIASRNELVVRSMIAVMTFHKEGEDFILPSYCWMAITFLRKIISKYRGLTATFLKQTPTDDAVDWLIQHVPETIEDHAALLGILSEKSFLTAPERLLAADGILGIVVAHGHRHQPEAAVLAYSSLSQFISSFFLVVGPVGVSVDSLVKEGAPGDATHSCRKAAFRMISTLGRVHYFRPDLRNECILAMQKLVALCKGENIVGLSGVATNHQKTVIKELLEGIVKAAVAMGFSLQV